MQRIIQLSALGLLLASGAVACGAAPGDDEASVGSIQQALTTITLEAENATWGNSVVESEHTGFTGSGYVNNANAVGSWIQWSVNSPVAASTQLRFRFANGASARAVSVEVNGQVVNGNLSFPGTGTWANWSTLSTFVNLAQGNNTIRLVATTSAGGPNYDQLQADVEDVSTPTAYLWPMVGQQGQDWVVNRYVDVDPGFGFMDYMGGTEVGLDGHYALDINIPNFRSMDDNSAQVVAIAGGFVDEPPVTGEFDRHTSFDPNAQANQVIIRQDDGNVAHYLHFKQNSITVGDGDRVEAGEVLGVVGSSGYSNLAHLHLALFTGPGAPLDPFAPNLWQSAPPYVVPAQLFDGIVIQEGAPTDDDMKDPPPLLTQIERDRFIGFGANVAGGTSGQALNMQLRQPNGTVVQTVNSAFLNYGHTFWYNSYYIPASAPVGTWSIDVHLAGQFQGSWPVEVLGGSTGPVTTTYQAEAGNWNAASVDNNHSGYTGSGFVNTDNATGTWTEWTVNVTSSGTAQIDVRYALSGSARPTSISLNGVVINSNFIFNGTGAWNSWQNASFSANLNAGSNVIRITGTSSASCPNFDALDVTL